MTLWRLGRVILELLAFSLLSVGISMAQSPCTAAVSVVAHNPFTFSSGGGSNNFTINTGGNGGVSCHWELTSSSFIHASPSSGGGGSLFQFQVNFSVDSNTTLAARTGVITVRQQEDGTSTTVTISQSAPTGQDFTIAASPTSGTVTVGSVNNIASVNISIARTGGFTGAVALSASGLPSGVTATFNPSSTTGTTSTLTLSAARNATTGQFAIIITGANGGVGKTATFTLTVNPRQWQNGDITVLTGAPPASAGTALGGHMNTAAVPNIDEVFNFDPSLHMDSPWWNWSWHITDLSGFVASPLAVEGSAITDHVNTIINYDEVFYLDPNHHLDSFWWDGNTWHVSDVTAASGAPVADPGSSVTGHINTRANADEVFYFCGGHVCGPWWQNWQWHVTDVTGVAGCCVPAMQGSALSSHFDTVANADEVFYQLPDQRIINLWWDGTWHATDVTTAAGSPLGAAGTSLSSHVNTVADVTEVFFIDTNGHLVSLWWQPYQWQTSDLTVITGAPLPSAGSQIVGYMNTLDGLDEVFYIGADQHIYQLWWSNWSWHFTDLTAIAGGPVAANGSSLNSHFNTVANTDQLYYIGTDQHIHLLWK